MKKRKNGFTLIELIVVIAIIGVLAMILVPSMIGYVQKAKKRSDLSTASSIYKAVSSILTENPDAYESFYKHNTETKSVSVSSKVNGGSYTIRVVERIDCNASAGSTGNKWYGGNSEANIFKDALNNSNLLPTGGSGYALPIKYTGGLRKPNRWYICYKDNDPEQIEIWSGDSRVGGGCGTPCYRMWPDPDDEIA